MKKTVGSIDKVVRVTVGLIFVIVAFVAPVGQVMKVILIVLGIIAFVTAFTGFCPMYNLLGINTSEDKDKDA